LSAVSLLVASLLPVGSCALSDGNAIAHTKAAMSNVTTVRARCMGTTYSLSLWERAG